MNKEHRMSNNEPGVLLLGKPGELSLSGLEIPSSKFHNDRR